MRMLRRIGLAAIGLGVTAAAGLAMLVSQISPERVQANALDQLRQISGYTVEAAPESKLVFWPRPGLTINDLTVDSAGRQIVKAPTAVIGFSLSALLQGRIEAGSIELISPSLEISRQEFDRVLQDPSANQTWGSITSFAMNDGQVQFTSGAKPVRIENVTLTIDHSGPTQQTVLGGQAIWAGRNVTAQMKLETLAVLHSGKHAMLDAIAKVDSAAATFSGRVRLAGDAYPHVQGTGSLTAGQPELLAALLGQKMPSFASLSDLETTVDVSTQASRLWLKARSKVWVNGRETALDATLSGADGWMEGDDVRLEVVNRTGGLYSVYFDGRADLTGNVVTGVLKGAVLDLPGVIAWTRQDLTQKWTRATLATDLTLAESGVAAQSIELKIDDTPINGSIAADLRGDKPVISASMQTTGIALPSMPLDDLVAALPRYLGSAADAMTVDLSLQDTAFAGIPIAQLDATVIRRGVEVEIDASRIDVFGGTAAFDALISGDHKQSVTGSLRAAEIDAAALTHALGHPKTTGNLGGSVEFSAAPEDRAFRLIEMDGQVTLSGGSLPIPDPTSAEPITDVDLADGRLVFRNDQLEFSDVQLVKAGQRWSGEARIATDQRTITGQMSPVGPTNGVSPVAIQGPLDSITLSLLPQQEPMPFNTTPSIALQESLPVDAATTELSARVAGGTTEPLQPDLDDQEPVEAAEPAYTGPPAPETLQSPVPRRPRR
ncbi:MAG: hypothetical protein AAF557_18310 [Pseudomonadota bacterium]